MSDNLDGYMRIARNENIGGHINVECYYKAEAGFLFKIQECTGEETLLGPVPREFLEIFKTCVEDVTQMSGRYHTI